MYGNSVILPHSPMLEARKSIKIEEGYFIGSFMLLTSELHTHLHQ
jgi:hypothetical protein